MKNNIKQVLKNMTDFKRIRTFTLAFSIALCSSIVMPLLVNVTLEAHAGARITADRATQRVKLGLNKSIVLELPRDAFDVLVSNPNVADAVTRTARRIYLFGKTVGETNIFIFGKNGEQIAALDLRVERDVSGLDAYIKRFIPTSNIKVEIVNDNIVLTGTVNSPLDSVKAVEIANIFVTGGAATADTARSFFDIPKSSIVNLLTVLGEDQVTLKVTVAEISRSVMKQLGVRNFSVSGNSGISFASGTGSGLGADVINSLTKVSQTFGTTSLAATLQAMEQTGVMKTLAEPSLTAISGEKATFKVGGEFNVVSEITMDADNDDRVSNGITKIDYGIGLEFKPTVLSAGRISLKVRTSVSEPTAQASVRAVTGNILSLRKRLADTTVELPSGGSMMIAGLVQDDIRQVIQGTPGLSKIPVLGTLFRSRSFQRNETELVIIVTPYLVRPTARNQLAAPTDNFNPASDGAGNLMGRVNRIYGTMKTNKPKGRYHGAIGFIYK